MPVWFNALVHWLVGWLCILIILGIGLLFVHWPLLASVMLALVVSYGLAYATVSKPQ